MLPRAYMLLAPTQAAAAAAAAAKKTLALPRRILRCPAPAQNCRLTVGVEVHDFLACAGRWAEHLHLLVQPVAPHQVGCQAVAMGPHGVATSVVVIAQLFIEEVGHVPRRLHRRSVLRHDSAAYCPLLLRREMGCWPRCDARQVGGDHRSRKRKGGPGGQEGGRGQEVHWMTSLADRQGRGRGGLTGDDAPGLTEGKSPWAQHSMGSGGSGRCRDPILVGHICMLALGRLLRPRGV